jgi:predicted O-linked N-acetylglucosamine transferase (SPINDLY family)
MAHNNLGCALEVAGQRDQAIECYRQAIQLDPNNAESHNNLSGAARAKQRFEEAAMSARRALAIRPDFPEALSNLGIALTQLRQPGPSVQCFRRLLRLRPNDTEALDNLGSALQALGEVDEAIDCFRQAIAIEPGLAWAHDNLGNALLATGRIKEGIAEYRKSVELKPADAVLHGNFIFTMHYDPAHTAASILAEQRIWNQRYVAPVKKEILPHPNEPDPRRRLRVGYVSGEFRGHVLGYLMYPLFRQHDPANFEIFCYSDCAVPDAFTKKLQALPIHWRDIAGQSDADAANIIREDRIDILIDLGMHMGRNRLEVFAHKPAPVQACYMAYPGGTGIDTMDYRITDPYLDPPGKSDADYLEKTIRLPHTYWCFDPQSPPLSPEPEPGPLPALTAGRVTFGQLNNFAKVSDRGIALWSAALAAVPQSRFILRAWPSKYRQELLEKFAQAGVSADRIEFAPPLPRLQYLQLYQRIDIGLDCLPYNGHTTSLDSFWMGVPVITRLGQTVVGRGGWSQLSNLGLTDLAAESDEQFIQIARDLAADLSRLAALRAGLRQRMENSPLMKIPEFTRDLETVYRQMWQAWCSKKSPIP